MTTIFRKYQIKIEGADDNIKISQIFYGTYRGDLVTNEEVE